MSNLIGPEALREALGSPDLRIVDTRFSLKDPQEGRRLYEQGHIPGALYFDLEGDLSAPPGEHGGRHPLPNMAAFARMLAARGIGNEHHVVVYDDRSGMFAGRLWWTLRYAGHDRVQVLDGGLSAWLEAGFEVTQEVPDYPPSDFSLHLRPEMVADVEAVRRKLHDLNVLLIDARGPERYRGEVEPLDKKAGHIPGAVNKPFTENLELGRFKSPEALRERFAEAEGAQEVIVYCGSGVSAAHDLLALEEAGIGGAKLYVGSWSDWSSFEENPVVTGEEP